MLQVKIVKPGEGKCIWAAGDHYFFKNTGDDTGGTYSLFEGLVPPGGGPRPARRGRATPSTGGPAGAGAQAGPSPSG